MANDHTIKIFTAADIEKYHKGQLSAREMHDLEKAALDDPFLADALEGYTTPGVNITGDLAELRQKLEEKTGKNKILPLFPGKQGFPWFRAAALFVLVAGAGIMVYLFTFKPTRPEIALQHVETNDKKNDSASSPATVADSLTANIAGVDDSPGVTTTDIAVVQERKEKLRQSGTQKDSDDPAEGKPVTTEISAKDELAVKKAEAPAVPAARNNEQIIENESQAKGAMTMKEVTAERVSGNDDKKPAAAKQQGLADLSTRKKSVQTPVNYFRGRVTDAGNNALPFANITNTADSIGTYSDAKGNFVLISPDSVLNVQVRSIGFENNTIQLQNNIASNKVVLKEDNSLPQVLISNRSANLNRSRNSMVLEESEPVDGWANYDLYIANNIHNPVETDRRQRTGGEVEVSFEVNENGQPVNITVEKSLCEMCDKEAIRLVKEGPRWKRRANKSRRTTVTIAF